MDADNTPSPVLFEGNSEIRDQMVQRSSGGSDRDFDSSCQHLFRHVCIDMVGHQGTLLNRNSRMDSIGPRGGIVGHDSFEFQ